MLINRISVKREWELMLLIRQSRAVHLSPGDLVTLTAIFCYGSRGNECHKIDFNLQERHFYYFRLGEASAHYIVLFYAGTARWEWQFIIN